LHDDVRLPDDAGIEGDVLMRTSLTVVFGILLMSAAFAQTARPVPTVQDDLLDRLIGTWEVSGNVHEASSAQTVEAEWVLNHQFVRIHEKTLQNVPGRDIPFEAFNYIGYDRVGKRYVVHPLNVWGTSGPSVAYGERKNNELAFSATDGTTTFRMR
jgi:hypothetical protein